MTMRQIQFTRTGGPDVLELVETELPPPASGEVRIANRAIGVNFIDIYFRTGLYPAELPGGMGFEGAGVIASVGPDVTDFEVGDRVAYVLGPRGAYADEVNRPTDVVVALPDAIDYETAAAGLLKGLTVQYLLHQTFAVSAGHKILFHAAAGGVGLIACQWARALGVYIIGTVSTEDKAETARQHGAWQTINYTRESVPERVLEMTDGHGVPVVYDSVGKATWTDSLKCLQKRGLMVSFGNASGPVEGVNLAELNRRGSLFVTRPSLGGYADTRVRYESMVADLFGVIASGDVHIPIGQRFDLADAAAAQQALADRHTTGSTILLP